MNNIYYLLEIFINISVADEIVQRLLSKNLSLRCAFYMCTDMNIKYLSLC